MKKNISAILSIVTSIVAIIIPMILPSFLKGPQGSFKETILAQTQNLKTSMSVSMLVSAIAIILGIAGVMAYKRNNSIKGNVMSIIGIVLGILVLIINFLANSISQMTSTLIPY